MLKQEQTNFITSDKKQNLSLLLRLCRENEELVLKELALKTLLGAKLFCQLEACIEEIYQGLYKLSKVNAEHGHAKSEKGQQIRNGKHCQAVFHGSSVNVTIAMARYERQIKQRLIEQYSSVINPELGDLAELKSKTFLALCDLLLSKAHTIQNITELDLSASLRWFMIQYKVGLRQLNSTIYPYLPQLNLFLAKDKVPENNTLELLEFLTTYRAICINQSDKQEPANAALALVESLLNELKQEFNEKEKWYIQNQEDIEQERLYAELFE